MYFSLYTYIKKEIETCASVFWGEILDKMPLKKNPKPHITPNGYVHGGVLAGKGRNGDFV